MKVEKNEITVGSKEIEREIEEDEGKKVRTDKADERMQRKIV